MKNSKIYWLILLLAAGLCLAQEKNELPNDSKPATSNIPGREYPRIDKDLRATFRVEAPEAQKVQLDLGKKYDMVKGDDGIWTVTTDPLVP